MVQETSSGRRDQQQQQQQQQQQPSQVEQVLENAQRDLANAEFHVPFLLNPIRDALLQPALGLANNILPTLTNNIPFGDATAAFCLSLPFNTFRMGYSLLHGSGLSQRRSMFSNMRLGTFVAEEIRRNNNSKDPLDLLMDEQDGSFFFSNVNIDVGDDISLNAIVLEPRAKGKHPAVIMVNSWTFDEHEYVILASKLAKRGYIVLSYCTRGFGRSGGLVDVAGPRDQKDLCKVLDFLQSNTSSDMSKVGIAGMSYGAGMALIGAATQDRISCAAALAGWGSLWDSLYGGRTPRAVWGAFLLSSGTIAGDLDPIIKEHLDGIMRNENIQEIHEWAAERSPITLIDNINRKNKPIYMHNSFGDDLFNANQAFHFFESLTGPKRMDCSQGIHGTPEAFGIFGEPNIAWDNAFEWFDVHLKGKKDSSSVMDAQVTMEVKMASSRDSFASWPCNEISTSRLYLEPRGFFSNGTLSTLANTEVTSTSIRSGLPIISALLPTAMTSGIPMVSPFFEAHLLHSAIPALLGINRLRTIVYFSPPLESTLKIRGHIRLNLTIASSTSKAQIVAYLYDDLGMFGLGKLISHGVISEHELTPNKETKVVVEITAAAYDVPAGHCLALAIDTRDPLYGPPTLQSYKLTVFHSAEEQSVLEFQCLDDSNGLEQ